MDLIKSMIVKYIKYLPIHILLIFAFYILGYISHSKFGDNNIIEELAETGLQTQGVTVEFSSIDSNANN